ncbi:hypothetical protein I312_102841 [Cryptococcus bacillisporus CA1280]|uniref:uncharacterized protein n=1 Tax=Cryptococcus bacillisporus CA1280 TaxID=1296109 RepID=UPI003366BC5D
MHTTSNAPCIKPFSDLFHGSNLASLIHDVAISRKKNNEVFDVSRRLSFVSKGRGLREGRCKGIYELTELTENERRDVLEFVFREDEARFGATRAGITAPCKKGGEKIGNNLGLDRQ